MLFADRLVVVRGGGDLATGVVRQLHYAGFPQVVLELEHPLAIRRTLAVATAITAGSITVDGLEAHRVETTAEAIDVASTGAIAVMASPTIPDLGRPIDVLVDARLAKRNLGTSVDQARLVVALGPGYTAATDCHAVVETMRGHRLGRVIWDGTAAPNTGVPGDVGGETSRRVIRAGNGGAVEWTVTIGDHVSTGDRLGRIADEPVTAPIAGVVRGLIADGTRAWQGLKIADVDPRADRSACFEISDKARLVGAGVLEAVLTWLDRS